MITTRLHSLQDPTRELLEVYEFWKTSWGEEFRHQGLSGIDTQVSDDFKLADEVRVVRVGDQVAGLMLVNHFDLKLSWERDHSYFKFYPSEFFDQHPQAKVTALRYFMVSPEFRKDHSLKIGHVLFGLCLKDYADSEDQILVGMTLKHHGANNLCAKFGAETIGDPQSLKHGVAVEYMKVRKENINHMLIERVLRGVVKEPALKAVA